MTRKSYYNQKIKRAAQLLFYKRHMKPGIKGWELKNKLGSDYPKILEVLDDHLEKLDLQIKTVFEGETPTEKPTLEQLNKARFFVTLRGGVPSTDAKMMGWRIDDIAGLAASISFIISKKGKTRREELSDFLRTKLPGWRVDMNLNRYIKAGYLAEDENGQMYLDWRTRAEVNEKELVDLLLK
ncbi:MAG: hypothetical protein NWF03_06490 [Candidatus Bathyarchaeota archaeon]|nr:hypothetical protein [Candidatus Bathyarchaeota archaeon]MCW4034996.1 hypothetical protein [Candidatus Bathyarchaeota archaeon]